MSDVHIVRFPSGLELRVPDGMDTNEFLARHLFMSLSEGICPLDQEPLNVAEGDSAATPGTGLPWLHHVGCGMYWQLDQRRQLVTEEVSWAWLGLRPPGWTIL